RPRLRPTRRRVATSSLRPDYWPAWTVGRARRLSPSPLAVQPHREEHVQRLEPVAPGDLLALRVRAAVVGDRELVDPQTAEADLRGDLRLDPEAVLAQVERAQNVDPERLVPGLHVVQRRVVEHVRHQAQETVSDQVPEEVGPLWPPASQARPEDDV